MRGIALLVACVILVLSADLSAQEPFDYATTTRLTGAAALGSEPVRLDVRGDLACVADLLDLVCLDVSDPGEPRAVGQIAHDGAIREVTFLDDTHVALVGATGWLRIYDVSAPEAPAPVGFLDLNLAAGRATLAGPLLVVLGATGLKCADVSDPTAPVFAGSGLTDLEFRGIATLPSGQVVVTGNESIRLVDLADPADPVVVDTLMPCYYPYGPMYFDVVVAGDLIFLTAEQPMPVGAKDGDRQLPYLVYMVDLLQPDDDGLVAYWETDWNADLRLHAAVGDLVYASVDETLVIFDAGVHPANVHALEPILALETPAVINDLAGGQSSVVAALAAPALATLPAAEAVGVPAVSRFGRGQFGGCLSSRWAWSITRGDLYYHPGYKSYLWDLADPLHPTRRDSASCNYGFEFFYDHRAITARGDLVIFRTSGPGATYLSLEDFGQDPPTTAGFNNMHRVAVFLDGLLLTYLSDGYGEADLDVFDIADPAAPVEMSSLAIEGQRAVRRLTGTRALVEGRIGTGPRHLQRLDLDDPADPQLNGYIETSQNVTAQTVRGDLVLVGDYNGNVLVIDHTTMTLLGTLQREDSGRVVSLAATADRIWICWSQAGVALVDLADPTQPALVSEPVALPGSLGGLVPAPDAPAAYVDCGLLGVQLVTAAPDGTLELVGGGGLTARGVGFCGDYVRTYGALLQPAVLDLTAAPITLPEPASRAVRAVPNPFNPQTVLSFATAAPGAVDLAVYDLRGRLVRQWRLDVAAAGEHAVSWDGRDQGEREVAAGVYLVRLKTATGTASGRACLVR